MRRNDLTGRKFGNLTVLNYEKTKGGRAYWRCLCQCGNISTVSSGNLTSGVVKSCGCLRKTPPNTSHRESNTKLYRHWVSMVRRCEKPNSKAYKWYGKRGIKVCEEWKTYEGFKAWVLATRPSEDYTVERIDVNGDYCPSNCTWIPNSEQANNRTTCVLIEYNGKKQNLMQWCEELGLTYKRIHNRMYKLGWSFERAISEPVNVEKRNKKGTKNG